MKNGYTRAQVVGRVVVILDSADVAIGCGVIVGSKGWVPEGRWGGGGDGNMTAACRSITEEIKAAWSDDKHVRTSSSTRSPLIADDEFALEECK